MVVRVQGCQGSGRQARRTAGIDGWPAHSASMASSLYTAIVASLLVSAAALSATAACPKPRTWPVATRNTVPKPPRPSAFQARVCGRAVCGSRAAAGRYAVLDACAPGREGSQACGAADLLWSVASFAHSSNRIGGLN